MELNHDPEANAIYVRFSDKNVAKTRPARGNSSDGAVDYAADGSVVGVELLGVSSGVDLTGLPDVRALYKLLAQEGFAVKVPEGVDAEPITGKSPRAPERQKFLGKLLKTAGIELDDLSEGARDALENYARFVLGSGDAPSASWNHPLVEIARAVESEMDATVGDVKGFQPLKTMALGEKAHWLKQRKDNESLRKALSSRGLSPKYFLDELPDSLLELASIRKVTGYAHGKAIARNATKTDAERALAIALTGPNAIVRALVSQLKNLSE